MKNNYTNIIKKIGKEAQRFLVYGLIFTCVFLAICAKTGFFANKDSDETSVVNHVKKITKGEVTAKIQEIGELSTYEYIYSGITKVENNCTVAGFNVPFTSHTVDIVYTGTIKAGYEVSDISIDINDDRQIIKVKLPDPQIFDNYINEESVACYENNNILNPIESEEVVEALKAAKIDELSKAETKGLYDHAKGHAIYLIKELMVDFIDEGYRVEVN